MPHLALAVIVPLAVAATARATTTPERLAPRGPGVRTAITAIEHRAEVPFQGELRLRIEPGRDVVTELDVGPRALQPVRVARHGGELSVEVDASRSLGEGRRPLAEMPRSLPARLLLASDGGPPPHPLSREGLARAAALAGFGYLAASLHDLDPQPGILRGPPTLSLERRWAMDGLFVTNGTRVHLPHGVLEWAAVAGTATLLVAAISVVAQDLFAGNGKASPDAAAVLISGFRVSVGGGAGWIKFGAPL